MRKIPLCIPYTGQEEKDAVCEVIDSGWYAHGPKNHEFEERFAEYLGVKHAFTMNSCTSALHLAVEGLGITGEVILPSFTFVASANAVITGGAKPVFADISYDTCNIDPASIERMISPQTEAIMPVHYGGQSADMTAIMEIAEKHKLIVIEDSAETIGGTHNGRLTGTFDIGCFSFYPTKNLTTGEGGMLTTNDDQLALKVKALLAHGIDKSTYEREDKEKAWYRSASRIGYNFRMSNILAAIGVEQLKKLPEMNRMRRDLATRLTEALAEIPEVEAPVERPENKHVYQMYTVRIKEGLDRDEFVRSLNNKGIGASIHFFPPVHYMPPYSGQDFRRDNLSVTEEVIREIITLPMYPQMAADDLAYMVDSIRNTVSELR
ncbi:MAG: DegT/DnrJ/EryC1/StrS family aminotransferase [Anaerolineales bacterium]|nr:DegT/DnrJ/EryC1/StrS family aminotransferase [Anaerolineales bacterium]